MDIFEIERIFKENFSFWDKLNEFQKNFILSNTVEAKYSKGQNIHGSSGECTGAIFIINGLVRAYMLSEDGKEITLYRLYSGDICMLSASCVLETITFDVQIDSEEDTHALIINAGAFSKVVSENIYAENFALKTATSRFSEVMWAMQQILFMSMDKRLAVFLNDESLRNNTDTINMTQEQIAKNMGSAREVVSRMLKYFSSEGIVKVSRGGVKIIDRQKLKNIAFY